MVEECPKKCVLYCSDCVICNEDYRRCVHVVCPGCSKIVPRTGYCINCGSPLIGARRPWE